MMEAGDVDGSSSGAVSARRTVYPSDLTDAEWGLVAPLIKPGKHGGRRRWVEVGAVMNGLLCVLGTGCQWRHLPRALPPRSTVHGYLQR